MRPVDQARAYAYASALITGITERTIEAECDQMERVLRDRAAIVALTGGTP